VDVVVATYSPDLKLLRHMLASYQMYWRDKGTLFIIAAQQDLPLIENMALPDKTKLLLREDFPELNGADPFKQQLYLKLCAYQFVTTEDFVVLDSDFVFLRPILEQDFYMEGRPIWYYRQWQPDDRARRWTGSDRLLGFEIPYAFLDTPQWVLKRELCAELNARFGLARFLTDDLLSEFLVYGAFCHRYFPGAYHFVDREHVDRPFPLAGKVNQVPPTFLHLDPACRYEQFAQYGYVAFWSHWELAERKMIEFFEASQVANFGRVLAATDQRDVRPAISPGPFHSGWARFVDGVASDGWVSQSMSFRIGLAEGQAVDVELMVPSNADDPAWRLRGYAHAGGSDERLAFDLQPGHRCVKIAAMAQPGSTTDVTFQFEAGFFVRNSPDSREFRAQLREIRLAPV
jgi:hypothetical protein